MRQERTCDIDGCDRVTIARGLCTVHYRRWQRHGDPLAGRQSPPRRPSAYPPACTVDGCDRHHYSRGYCKKHYERWATHGDPHTVAVRTLYVKRPIEERFAEKWTFGPGGCWLWTGSKDTRGYGRIGTVTAVPRLAHRIAYELAVGPIPPGLEIDHLCFTPSCVNPDHLEAVTPAENNRRRRHA